MVAPESCLERAWPAMTRYLLLGLLLTTFATASSTAFESRYPPGRTSVIVKAGLLTDGTGAPADAAPDPKSCAGVSFTRSLKYGENDQNVLSNIDLVGAFVNTLIVAGALATLVMLFDSLAAFAFAKYEFPGKNVLFVILLATFLVPGSLSLVPSFVLMSAFGWIGDLRALIIPGAANAFGIFFMRQYMSTLPDELLDAARIDGASEFGIFRRVVLPISVPALVSLSIIFFMASWNNFLWPIAVLRSPDQQTVPLMLNSLQGPPGRTAFDVLMAGSVVSLIPMLLVFLVLQRYLIGGITAGSVKG